MEQKLVKGRRQLIMAAPYPGLLGFLPRPWRMTALSGARQQHVAGVSAVGRYESLHEMQLEKAGREVPPASLGGTKGFEFVQ